MTAKKPLGHEFEPCFHESGWPCGHPLNRTLCHYRASVSGDRRNWCGQPREAHETLAPTVEHPDGSTAPIDGAAPEPEPEPREEGCTCGEKWPCKLHGGPPEPPQETDPSAEQVVAKWLSRSGVPFRLIARVESEDLVAAIQAYRDQRAAEAVREERARIAKAMRADHAEITKALVESDFGDSVTKLRRRTQELLSEDAKMLNAWADKIERGEL